MDKKFDRERWHYPVLDRYTYLDTATTGLIPQYACDAMNAYLQNRTNLAMDIDDYHLQWDFADDVRDEIAAMIGAESGDEIAFGQNSSTLFNIFCNGLAFEKGDNVVIYENAFPAMTYVWLNMKEQLGLEVRVARALDGETTPEALFALADEHTKAITVCHVDSGNGYRHDLKAIGTWCREHGIAFGVDATQGCGAMRLDVKDMKIDFLTTSAYKWLQGVQGIGFAFIDKAFMKCLRQTEMGWANVADRINGEPFDLVVSSKACRFENGGLPAIGLYGLHETIASYMRLGGEDIENYILDLTDYLYRKAEMTEGISIAFPHDREHRSGLISLRVPGGLGLTESRLRANGMRAKIQGEDRMRIALHYYNNTQDIDRLIGYLESCMAKSGGQKHE